MNANQWLIIRVCAQGQLKRSENHLMHQPPVSWLDQLIKTYNILLELEWQHLPNFCCNELIGTSSHDLQLQESILNWNYKLWQLNLTIAHCALRGKFWNQYLRILFENFLIIVNEFCTDFVNFCELSWIVIHFSEFFIHSVRCHSLL
jgi:hypothetical protein